MAQQIIDFGTPPAGTDGDTTPTALQKAQANFTELYGTLDDANAAAAAAQTTATAAQTTATAAQTTATAAQTTATAAQTTATALAAQVSPGYIDGLNLSWNSATSVTIGPGAAYIPGNSAVLVSNAAITLNSVATAAGVNYAYLYSNAGTPAVEISSTAPSNYFGTAWTKTGDNTRRFIGYVVASAANTITNFQHNGGNFKLFAPIYVLLNNGAATTYTTVSAASVTPPNAYEAQVIMYQATAGVNTRISNSAANLTLPSSLFSIQGITYFACNVALASQAFQYAGTSAGAFTVNFLGCNFTR